MSVHHDGNPPPQVWVGGKDGPWEPSMARQSEKESCDVNVIISRFESSSELPVFREGMYADVSEIGDYRASLEKVRAADEHFRQLPAKVRAAFNNDPAEFLDAVSSAQRGSAPDIDRMVELGLAVVRPSEKPADKPAEAPKGGA